MLLITQNRNHLRSQSLIIILNYTSTRLYSFGEQARVTTQASVSTYIPLILSFVIKLNFEFRINFYEAFSKVYLLSYPLNYTFLISQIKCILHFLSQNLCRFHTDYVFARYKVCQIYLDRKYLQLGFFFQTVIVHYDIKCGYVGKLHSIVVSVIVQLISAIQRGWHTYT